MSGTPLTYDYINAEGKAGTHGRAADGNRGRGRSRPGLSRADAGAEAAAQKAQPEWKPDVDIPRIRADFQDAAATG
jgi:hypothetical protein